MAEAIVGFVAEKLGDLIVKEAQLLGGVRDQVEAVKRELDRIRCYLRDADSKRRLTGGALVEHWLNELRDVAYCIEDAVDTFLLELDDSKNDADADDDNKSRQKRICRRDFFKGLGQTVSSWVKEVPGLHRLGTELAEIQQELDEIFRSKDRYGIQPLQEQGEPPLNVVLPQRRAAYDDVDDEEVVGLQSDKNNLLQLLCSPEETPRRAVITIVGPGGLGKTTLARMVYNSAKVGFKYHMMLSVSQQYNLTNLLRMMLWEGKHFVLENQDVGYYVNELKNILSGKRYLIILDDVWEVNLWGQLKPALPDDKNGSQVLITSRNENVAISADPRMTPYELALLNDEESLNLLLKNALPSYQEPTKDCPSDLLDLANALSKKCKGLPLALIVLGGILSMRGQAYNEWKKVLDTMDWFEEGKDCMNILALSYDDMSYYLKPCFLYLALFPEDYEISAKRLIRMWVAEGFIPRRERKTLEEVAEIFLDQLLQRGMVQVTSRRIDGSIEQRIRVHDLVRELAMREAAKQNFVVVEAPVRQGQGVGHNNNRSQLIRRVSHQFQFQLSNSDSDSGDDENKEKFIKAVGVVGPNTNTNTTRSFFCFGTGKHKLKGWDEFRLLRVLHIERVRVIEVKGLDRLIHLKYLEFIDCIEIIFPDDFWWGHLKQLETLLFRNCGGWKERMEKLGLWTIGTLRHVIVVGELIEGPPAGAELRNLQTLGVIKVPAAWRNIELNQQLQLEQLRGLNNLRELRLWIEKEEEEWDGVAPLLATLPHLLSLLILICWDGPLRIPEEIVYPRVLPNYHLLQSLVLWGPLGVDTLEARLFPPHLLKLALWDSRLKQDPTPELGKLTSLKKLLLLGSILSEEGGKEMRCPSGGFPILETLQLECLDGIESLMVMEGAMPNLKHLTNYSHVKLNMPPALKHLLS